MTCLNSRISPQENIMTKKCFNQFNKDQEKLQYKNLKMQSCSLDNTYLKIHNKNDIKYIYLIIMATKRPSKDSQNSQKKPSFQEPPKEDDKKSVQNSQLNDSKEVADSQEKQAANSKFDMPTMPKFQSLQLREYFDAKLSAVLLEGLKEIGRVRPENPTKFLGEYLIKQADSK